MSTVGRAPAQLRGMANRRGATMSVAAARDRFAAGKVSEVKEPVRTKPVVLPGSRGGRGRGDSVAAARSRFQGGFQPTAMPVYPNSGQSSAAPTIAARVPSERRPQEKTLAERFALQVAAPKLITYKLDEISKQVTDTITDKTPRKMGSWYYTQLKELQEANVALAKKSDQAIKEASNRYEVAMSALERKWREKLRSLLKTLLDVEAENAMLKAKMAELWNFLDEGEFGDTRIRDLRTKLHGSTVDEKYVTDVKLGMRTKLMNVFMGMSTVDSMGNKLKVDLSGNKLQEGVIDNFLSGETTYTMKEDGDFTSGKVAMAASHYMSMMRPRDQFENRGTAGGAFGTRRRMQLMGNTVIGSVAHLKGDQEAMGLGLTATNGYIMGDDMDGVDGEIGYGLLSGGMEGGTFNETTPYFGGGLRLDPSKMSNEEKEMFLLDENENLDLSKLDDLHRKSGVSLHDLRELVSSLVVDPLSKKKDIMEVFDVWAAQQESASNSVAVSTIDTTPPGNTAGISPKAELNENDIVTSIKEANQDEDLTADTWRKSGWLTNDNTDNLFAVADNFASVDLEEAAILDAIGNDLLGIKPLNLPVTNPADPDNLKVKEKLRKKWAWKKLLELQRLKLLIRGCVALKCRFTGWIVPVDSFFLHLCESSEVVDMEALFDGTLYNQEKEEDFMNRGISDIFIPKDLLECVEEDHLLSQQIHLSITELMNDPKAVGNSYKYVIELHVGRIIWTIYRRYIDFVNLHRELVAVFARSDFPWEVVPKWSLFTPSKNELLLKLRGLEYYLQSVVAVKYMRDDPLLRSFLHLDIGLS